MWKGICHGDALHQKGVFTTQSSLQAIAQWGSHNKYMFYNTKLFATVLATNTRVYNAKLLQISLNQSLSSCINIHTSTCINHLKQLYFVHAYTSACINHSRYSSNSSTLCMHIHQLAPTAILNSRILHSFEPRRADQIRYKSPQPGVAGNCNMLVNQLLLLSCRSVYNHHISGLAPDCFRFHPRIRIKFKLCKLCFLPTIHSQRE